MRLSSTVGLLLIISISLVFTPVYIFACELHTSKTEKDEVFLQRTMDGKGTISCKNGHVWQSNRYVYQYKKYEMTCHCVQGGEGAYWDCGTWVYKGIVEYDGGDAPGGVQIQFCSTPCICENGGCVNKSVSPSQLCP